VQLLQQHQFGAGDRGPAQARLDGIQVGVAAAAVGFLQQRDLEGLAVHHGSCRLWRDFLV